MCLGAPERCHSPPRPVCEVQQYLGISGERDRGVRCVSLIDWQCDLAGLEIMVAPYLSPQDKILFFPGLLTRNFKLSCLKMLPIQDAEVCAGTSWLVGSLSALSSMWQYWFEAGLYELLSKLFQNNFYQSSRRAAVSESTPGEDRSYSLESWFPLKG